MSEKCPNCSAVFKVTEISGHGICGACREPITCPHCHKIVREERTTGWFDEKLVKAPESQLCQFLGITDNEWEAIGSVLEANTGHNDEMTYSYYFIVPENIPEDILNKTKWKVGDIIRDIPVWIVESDGCKELIE
jgi:hypothetical protein